MAAVAIHPFQTVSECTSNLRYLEKAQWIKICETISCNASGYKRRLYVIWPVLTMLSPFSFKKPRFQKQSPHPDWGWWINSILRFWCFDGAPSCGTSSVMSPVLQNYPKCYNPRMNWKQPPESTTMSKRWEAYRHGSVWGPKKWKTPFFRTKPGKHLKQKHNEIHIEIHPQICLVGAQIHPQIPKEWFGWVSQAGPDDNHPMNAFKAVSFLIVPFLESRSFCWTRWFKGKKLFSEILRIGGIYISYIYIYVYMYIHICMYIYIRIIINYYIYMACTNYITLLMTFIMSMDEPQFESVVLSFQLFLWVCICVCMIMHG